MDLLLNLIDTLSKEEKAMLARYGAMVAGNRRDRVRELYRCILEAKRSGQDHWKDQLPPVLKRRYNLYASRLLNRILESQRTFSADRSISSQVTSLLADIDFLYRKKQFALCWRKLRKGKKLARQFEMESSLLDFLRWERNLHAFSSTRDRSEIYHKLQVEAREVAVRLGEQWELLGLLEDTMALARKEVRIRTPEVASRFEALLSHPLLAADHGPERFLAWHTRHMAHGIHETCRGDYHAALHWLRPLFMEWETRPQWISHEPQLFLRACNAFLSCLIFSEGDYLELESVFGRIRKRTSLSAEMRVEFEQMSYYQELLFSLNYQPGQKLQALLREVGQWFERNTPLLNPTRQAVLLYNMTLAAFCYGDHPQAIRWNNRLLGLGQGHERHDILDFARIFQLVLQFERGNFDLNAYLSRSAYRYFKRTEKLELFERTLIRFIDQLSERPPGQDHRADFEELESEIRQIVGRSGERDPVGLNIVLFWIEGKKQNRSLAELTAENAAKNRNRRQDPDGKKAKNS